MNMQSRYKYMLLKIGVHTGAEVEIMCTNDHDLASDVMLAMIKCEPHPKAFRYTIKFDYLEGTT